MTKFLSTLFFILVLNSCANIVSPTGGLTDKTPPILVASIPNNESTNIQANTEILLEFNENIQAISKITILPEIEGIKVSSNRNKLRILLPDSLGKATYQVFLNGEVKDLNEGNIYSGKNFVFSTNNAIDSAKLSIQTIEAKFQKPKGEVKLIAKSIKTNINYPINISKTGTGELEYLAEGLYIVSCYQDANRNDTIDTGESVYLYDTLIAQFDSLIVDSLNYYEPEITELSVQQIDKGIGVYHFNQNDEIKFELNIDFTDSISKDSIHYFFLDSIPKTVIINSDTIRVKTSKSARKSKLEITETIEQELKVSHSQCSPNQFMITTELPISLTDSQTTIGNIDFTIQQINNRTLILKANKVLTEEDTLELNVLPIKPIIADTIRYTGQQLKLSKKSISYLILPKEPKYRYEIYNSKLELQAEGILNGETLCLNTDRINVYLYEDNNQNKKWDIDIYQKEIEQRKSLPVIELVAGWEIELEIPN